MSRRLTEMVRFLYERQQMRFAEQWTANPSIAAESKRRWPDATEAETAQSREMAVEMHAADMDIKLLKRLDAGELPPGRSDVH